jgi:hypothetical protein
MEMGRLCAPKAITSNVEIASSWGLKKDFGLSKIEEIEQVMRRYYPVTSVPNLLSLNPKYKGRGVSHEGTSANPTSLGALAFRFNDDFEPSSIRMREQAYR